MNAEMVAYRGQLAGYLAAAQTLISIPLADARQNLERNPDCLVTKVAIKNLTRAMEIIGREMDTVWPLEKKAEGADG